MINQFKRVIINPACIFIFLLSTPLMALSAPGITVQNLLNSGEMTVSKAQQINDLIGEAAQRLRSEAISGVNASGQRMTDQQKELALKYDPLINYISSEYTQAFTQYANALNSQAEIQGKENVIGLAQDFYKNYREYLDQKIEQKADPNMELFDKIIFRSKATVYNIQDDLEKELWSLWEDIKSYFK